MVKPNIFSLTQLEAPNLTKGEAQAVASLLQSDAWKIVERILDWQSNVINLRLINANRRDEGQPIEYWQGKLIGFELARQTTHDIAKLAEIPEPTLYANKEQEFMAKWLDGADVTGYQQ